MSSEFPGSGLSLNLNGNSDLIPFPEGFDVVSLVAGATLFVGYAIVQSTRKYRRNMNKSYYDKLERQKSKIVQIRKLQNQSARVIQSAIKKKLNRRGMAISKLGIKKKKLFLNASLHDSMQGLPISIAAKIPLFWDMPQYNSLPKLHVYVQQKEYCTEALSLVAASNPEPVFAMLPPKMKTQERVQQEDRNQKYGPATLIQCTVRRHLAANTARQLRQEKEKRKAASTAVQRIVRRHLAMKKATKLQKEKQTQKGAATVIQCIVRRHLATKQASELQIERKAQKISATVIQCTVRRHLALQKVVELRKQNKAATVLQYAFRRHLAVQKVKDLRKQVEAATVIQCTGRRHLAKKHTSELQNEKKAQKEAATVIQSTVRRRLASQKVGKMRKKIEAATVIQSTFRRHHAVQKGKDLRKQINAATVIQCTGRRHLAIKQASEFQKEKKARKEAAIVIQCTVRSHLAIQKVVELRKQNEAATVIQSTFRRHYAVQKVKDLRKQIEAAKEIQVLYKSGMTLRQVILVMKVQAKVRGYLARKRYIKLINEQGAVNQIFRYDMSVRRLVYGNQHKLFSMYKQYIVFPAQALDRKGMLQIAQDFNLVPSLCNRREINQAVDEVSKRNKKFSPGGPVLLSFEQFLKFLIYVSLNHVKNAPYDEAVYKFNTLLAIMDTSEGHSKVTKSRYTTFVERFMLFDSGNLPSPAQLRNIDLAKIIKPKKISPSSKSKPSTESDLPRYERSNSMHSDSSSVSTKKNTSSLGTLKKKAGVKSGRSTPGSGRSTPRLLEHQSSAASVLSDDMSDIINSDEDTKSQQYTDEVLRYKTPPTFEKAATPKLTAPTFIKNTSTNKR